MAVEVREIRRETRAFILSKMLGAIGGRGHAVIVARVLFSGMRAIFSHRIEVRFRDCDPMGHVNNAVYLTYLEQARLAQWRDLWGFGRAPEAPPVVEPTAGSSAATPVDAAKVPGVILARTEVDYRIPARYGDVLEVRIGLAAVGRTSFTYDYEILDAQARTVASARSVQVMYDYTAGRPVPIPDGIRRLFDAL
jgi:acyl-CoA thioester hydrolase